MIRYMCKYTPVELLESFGIPVLRLDPSVDSFEQADALGHANLCGYGKGLLEEALSPDVQELVLVNCCDVVRRIYDILKKNKPMRFLYLIDLPHKCGPAEERKFKRELEKLIAAYTQATGRNFSPEYLRKAWKATSVPRPADQAERVISLQGAHCGNRVYDAIHSTFSLPVRDDTCSGGRCLKYTLAEAECGCQNGETAADDASGHTSDKKMDIPSDNLLAAYASALLRQIPCLRMLKTDERAEQDRNACGIIYHTMKFCDYYSFEYAKKKEEGGIPLLKIETDGTIASGGQLSTRLEAFAESLSLGSKEKKMAQQGNYFAGIDSGSTSTDVVILDREKKLVSWSIVRTGAGAAAGAKKALDRALEKAGLEETDLGGVITTGYGRAHIGKGDASITEITCHAKGANYLNPKVRTIIDIGGQDSKVIRVDEHGSVQNFAMNDKCAAGTGRFLEMMARTLDLSLEEMSEMGLHWKNEITISSMCTVFAESEVVSLIAGNTDPADIIHGLNQAVAAKTSSLVRRTGMEEGVMMTGGVAKNRGIVSVLGKKLGVPVFVSEYSQLCGAIGAALLAMEQ